VRNAWFGQLWVNFRSTSVNFLSSRRAPRAQKNPPEILDSTIVPETTDEEDSQRVRFCTPRGCLRFVRLGALGLSMYSVRAHVCAVLLQVEIERP
jgi:hypothetical protein